MLDVAFRYLIENAVVHADRDGPDVRVRVLVGDGHAAVVFEDEGPGIPDLELEALARGVEGALSHTDGLGLWLVTWIVENSGGERDVGREGGSTVVTVALPAAADEGSDGGFGPSLPIPRL